VSVATLECVPASILDTISSTKPVIIVVQTLETSWTKASRGGPAAARRNGTPKLLDLPALLPERSEHDVVWHAVRFGEPDFTPTVTLRALPLAQIRVAGLDLKQVDGHVHVDLFGKTQMVVQLRQIGELRYNWVEDVIEDGWRSSHYHQVIARVACGTTWDVRMFRREPTHAVAVLKDLP
jgi:hypothetical protein